MEDDDKLAKVEVPAEDPDQSEERQKEREKKGLVVGEIPSDGKQTDEGESLTEEDRLLKEKLDGLVTLLKETGKPKDRTKSLDDIRTEIRSSTSTMTSVPKPLKFLRGYYDDFKKMYDAFPGATDKQYVADIISVLAMTVPNLERENLKYRLAGSSDPIGSWGHEYVRNLAGEIGQEYAIRQEKSENVNDLMDLVDQVVPYNMDHNAEAEACDMLVEVDCLDRIKGLVNKSNHARTCRYLLRLSNYMADKEEQEKVLRVAYDIYVACGVAPDALRVAIKLDSPDLMSAVFSSVEDKSVRNQLAFIMGSQRLVLDEFEIDDEIMVHMGNSKLHGHYMYLARELEVLEPKSPDDIYKKHLTDNNRSLRRLGGEIDSAKQNLASTYVNAFVNCGFGKDLLMTPEGSDWMYKNKEHGMMAATASVGLIMLWDLEEGFASIDKYSYSNQDYLRAGAMLASGLVSAGVTSEDDAAFGLLSDQMEKDCEVNMKTGAILGLGLSYAGTAKQDIYELLVPIIGDRSQSMELVSMAALSLGLVFVGTANDDVSGSMLDVLMDRSETDLNDSSATFLSLGLGLLFLGKGEVVEVIIDVLSAVEHRIGKVASLVAETCAYVASGNVLQVQKLLAICGEHLSEEEPSEHQQIACLGIALIAMGEDLGAQMALRSFDNILQYCEVSVRRAVPLALALLHVSHPDVAVTETLSKLSHDSDEFVSQNAVLALGLIGAGTNNSLIAQLLRQLAVYYQKEPNHLFLVRVAQGLLHLGKGLLTLSPFQYDSLLCSKVAVAGILTLLHSCIDMKNNLLSKRHYLLYAIVTAIRPRVLITLDEELNPVSISVRVGQAVDTVGQAGSPRDITGFQTHNTPVLLSRGERAELASDAYIPLTNILEGIVIVRKNEDAMDVDE